LAARSNGLSTFGWGYLEASLRGTWWASRRIDLCGGGRGSSSWWGRPAGRGGLGHRGSYRVGRVEALRTLR